MTQPHFMEYVSFFIGTINRMVDQKPKSLGDTEKLQQLNQVIAELKKLLAELP